MLLTIHNLPATTRYADIKSLLQSKCGLQHVILDNLASDGGGKKVTVGVAEDADAAILVRKINGLYWNGQQLYVEDVRQQKTASEQPFRSTNPHLQEQTDPSFRPMNLQQHTSYAKGVPMAGNMMTPMVQPMMAAMYYVPDYTNNIQTERYEGYMQTDQGYVQHSEKVQSAYMGTGTQSATQITQFGMTKYNENQQEFCQSEKRSGWGEDYSEERDFAAEKPTFGQRSPPKSREGNWFNDQQNRRQESPSRERSRGNREPSWTLRGSDNRGPTQPDFRSSVRPTQPDFRSNIRSEERAEFVKPTPDFRPNNRSGMLEKPARRDFLFPERSSEFSGRPNELGGFSGGQNDRQRRPNESERFSGRLNEFSGRSSEYQAPNEFSGRPNKLGGFSEEQNDRQGRPNENERFSGRLNEFNGRSSGYQASNEIFERRKDFSGRPNEFSRTPNVFSGKPNNRQGRPNEFSERQGRPNERQGRPNDRPGPSRPNERAEFGHSDNRPSFELSNERPTFSRRGGLGKRGGLSDRGHPKPGPPESKKRKFEETRFENRRVERPERLSRPDSRLKNPTSPKQFRDNTAKKFAPRPIGSFKAKPTTEEAFIPYGAIRPAGVRYVIYDMYTNLGIKNPNLVTRETFKMFIAKRMDGLNLDKTGLTPQKCFELYRAKYPRSDDKATYDTLLGLIAQRIADEASGITVPVEAPKPKQDKPIALKPVAQKPITLAPKLSKGAKKAKNSIKLAKQQMSQGKVPHFPLGDKSKVAQHKKEERERYIPEVEGPYKAAIEDEIKPISDIFLREFKNVQNKKLQEVHDTVRPSELINEMQQLLTQGLARRISNSGLKVIRVYGAPKLPTREVLEKFLRRFGAQSLRKSVRSKMYTVSVDTYKNHDRLCALQPVQLPGGITISFKPFHLAPKPKANQPLLKVMRKKIIADMIDKSDLNLLDKDWPAKEAEIKAKEAEINAKKAEEQLALEAKRAEAEKQAANAKEQVDEAEKQPTNAKEQIDEAEKITTCAEKQNEEALLNENYVLDKDNNLTDTNDESNIEFDESNDYLDEDFHVIDEVNETDSDIEYIGHNDEVVNIDDDNEAEVIEDENDVDGNNDDGNDIEKEGDGKNMDENNVVDVNNDAEHDDEIEENQDKAADIDIDDVDLDIDDVDVDINDMDDDDLEDY